MAKTIIKYGGLLMSAALTLSLFLNIFGKYGEFYSWLMAVSALALFEGGALLWNHLTTIAKGRQRGITKLAMWLCVGASLVSSCLQIMMSTDLWKPGFDTGLAALITIAASLAVNITFVVMYEMFDPERHEKNRDLDRTARAQDEMYKLSDKVTEKAFAKADRMVEQISGRVSNAIAKELQWDVVMYLLSQTRDGNNTMQLPDPTTDTLPDTLTLPDPTEPTPQSAPLLSPLQQRIRSIFTPRPSSPVQTLGAEGVPSEVDIQAAFEAWARKFAQSDDERTQAAVENAPSDQTPKAPETDDELVALMRVQTAQANIDAEHGKEAIDQRTGYADPVPYADRIRVLEEELQRAKAEYEAEQAPKGKKSKKA